MKKIVVSACLLGENCKYNGGNNWNPAVAAFVAGREVIPVCPECQAGLGCPRTPAEIVDGVFQNRDGVNWDAPIRRAIDEILAQLDEEEVELAILQSRSPTCGVNQIYDGTFTGRKITGSGLFAQALHAAGYPLLDAEDCPQP